LPSRRRVLSGRQVAAILEANGFAFVSQRGSHWKYRRGDRVVVVPDHDPVRRGTLASIVRQSGLPAELFAG
jgi:predicted RNA binding protein YcfA (HicA-like mRNA interferase family)